MLLADVAAASAEVGATSLAAGQDRPHRRAARPAAEPDEVAIVVSWLSGELPQRQIGVGWASLRSLPPAGGRAEPDRRRGRRDRSPRSGRPPAPVRRPAAPPCSPTLFGAATAAEQTFLRRLLGGELRQGALLGVMADAVARAAGRAGRRGPPRGDAGRRAARVAAAALDRGAAALAEFRLQVGPPGRADARADRRRTSPTRCERLGGRAVFEAKLDGARVQIHRDGDERRDLHPQPRRRHRPPARGRRGDARAAGRRLVADGEAIALRPDGRPHTFQVTASRFGRSVDIAAARATQPLSVFFFDVLHRDGADLLDAPGEERAAVLRRDRPGRPTGSTGWSPPTPPRRSAFLDRTLAAGHEGVMAKSLTAPYEAGRRGAGWLKVKPVHTLDLVVLAVEWGSGRRTGKLSNIHLGARDPQTGGFVMLGKTFKGMTDEMLDWQTQRFLELADGPDGRLRRPGAPRAGRRDRLRRRPGIHAATPAAWRCASPGCCATATTSARTRPTPSTPSARSTSAEQIRLRFGHVRMVEDVDASTDSRRFVRSLSARQAALFLGQLFRDPLVAYDRLRHEHGDTVRLPYSPRRSFFFLSRPEYAEQVLVAHQTVTSRPSPTDPSRPSWGTACSRARESTGRRTGG